jgi:hypothetical protein
MFNEPALDELVLDKDDIKGHYVATARISGASM